MQWLDRTPQQRWPEFVRGDIGYGTQTWMLELESEWQRGSRKWPLSGSNVRQIQSQSKNSSPFAIWSPSGSKVWESGKASAQLTENCYGTALGRRVVSHGTDRQSGALIYNRVYIKLVDPLEEASADLRIRLKSANTHDLLRP